MDCVSIWRSVLFVPGHRPDRFGRALNSGADAVCMDLEDAVPPSAKSQARDLIRMFLETEAPASPDRLIRINALPSLDGLRDLTAIAASPSHLTALVAPKVESARDIALIAGAFEAGRRPALVALLETARGLTEARAIAAAPSVAAIMFGSADYAAQIGCAMSAAALAFPRGQIVQAAGEAGIAALDGAFLDLHDENGLARDSAESAAFGFVGRPALHPKQVPAINAAYTPSAAEISHAEDVVRADADANGGATTLHGRLLDAPIVAQARHTLRRAKRTPNLEQKERSREGE